MKFKILTEKATLNKIKFFKKGDIIELGGLGQNIALKNPNIFQKIKNVENIEEIEEDSFNSKSIDFSNLTKKEIQNVLMDKSISFSENSTKKELLKLL